MLNNYRDAAFKSNDAAPVFSDSRKDTVHNSPVRSAETTVESDRAVMQAAPTLPGVDAVRALLVLAAESAFALQDGIKDSVFVAQLIERSESLEQTLATPPKVDAGADYSLGFRRARQAVAVLNEMVRRELLEKIDETTDTGELEATLQNIKGAAVEAGKALKLIDILDSGIR